MADRAISEVSRYLTVGAANKLGDVVSSGGYAIICVLKMRYFDDAVRTTGGWIDEVAEGAKANRCGNCGEQAAIAFAWLRDQGVRPLDFMSLEPGDHAFVVIGRAAGSDPNRADTWGRTAVICDPWKNEFYAAASISAHLERTSGFASVKRLD